jgi:hypothetical protein
MLTSMSPSAAVLLPGALAAAPEPWQKPREICEHRALPPAWSAEEVSRYVALGKRRIEMEVARCGVRLHTPGPEHLDAILRFAAGMGTPPLRALNAYELHRVLCFGRPLVLLGPGGEILGYDLTFDSSGDGERTLATCGYAVAPALAGHNLGAKMITYSALRGMEAGAVARRGIVSPRNAKSLATLLNHLGAVCDGFLPAFGNWGEPRFTHACRLTPAGLSGNRIDPRRVAAFLATARQGSDYLLVDGGDSRGLERIYRDTPFRVAAVLSHSAADAGPCLLAVPLAPEG